MHAHRYHQNYAEEWLSAARERKIDAVERMTEEGGLSSLESFQITLIIKLDCLAAVGSSLVSGVASFFEALWYTCSEFVLRHDNTVKIEEAWDQVHRAIDVFLSGFSALFDSDAVLSAADRGNIRKICDLGRQLQDVGANPSVNPQTRKELETWYRNAKVFMRQGGGEAKKELCILADALDHIRITPDTAPEKLLGWRWEHKATGSVAVEKIRGIRWKQPESIPTESLSKRAWKKKS